ncbi:hypothetical protein IFR05_002548 [Cadophora sp. M221]|nr:hypothetical protein IFR05_002548 [Cadophora sp. M221]
MSRHTTPIEIDDDASQAFEAPSATSSTAILNPFSQMMAPKAPAPLPTSFSLKDNCKRPVLEYNDNYNLYRSARDDLPANYSPYVSSVEMAVFRPTLD